MNRPPESTEGLALSPLALDDVNGGDQLLQTGFWGHFKEAAGWTPRAYRWCLDSDKDGHLLVLERRFPGGFSMAYVPYGPFLPFETAEGLGSTQASDFLAELSEKLRPYLSPQCFMLRFDLCGGSSGRIGHPIADAPKLLSPLRKAPYRVQPQDTIILPLVDDAGKRLDDDVLLSGMHKKTRYNIRLAARKGVKISRLQGAEALHRLSDWYRIYKETGERDGIALHSEVYYQRLFEMAGSANDDTRYRVPSFSLYMAVHENDDLAGIIVSRSGGRSTYMYGASASHKRELMPNQLLQWTAIKDAAAEGGREYDFFGIPPADDPAHPMHGLWRFKTGFGGRLHHYLGAWDRPYMPPLYAAYGAAEKIRGFLAAVRKKR